LDRFYLALTFPPPHFKFQISKFKKEFTSSFLTNLALVVVVGYNNCYGRLALMVYFINSNEQPFANHCNENPGNKC